MANPTQAQIETARILAKNDWEANFIESVSEQIADGRKMSEKQMAIFTRIQGNASKGNKGEGKTFIPEPQEEGDYKKISELLNLAGTKLKKPKITFEVSRQTVVVSLAPSTGKNPGSSYIKVDGEYYGKVSKAGHLRSYGNNIGIIGFLDDMADDPSMAARTYGKRTGRCCFCNAPLKTLESTSHGYGPVCAKNWGLVWNKKSANAILDDEAITINMNA